MAALDDILNKLKAGLETQDIELYDFSEAHSGHHSMSGLSKNLHLMGKIRSPKFKGLNRLQRERLVNQLVASDFADGTLHALSLTLEEA